jgi:multisubunit Na+/H+ antiporter MnhC subunit
MTAFLKVIGILMMVTGGLVALVAKSAFHEILAATGIGLGAVVLALGVVANYLASILDFLRARFPMTGSEQTTETSPVDPAPKADPVVSWKSRGNR